MIKNTMLHLNKTIKLINNALMTITLSMHEAISDILKVIKK